jgi:hypothetical protein
MVLAKIKNSLTNNLKNMYGWKTDRKIVVISVDDYGNVRVDSRKAVEEMDEKGIKVKSPFKGFDLYDTLETKEDLEVLYETLTSVKDSNGRSAVFTPFTLPCNIDFEAMQKVDFREYVNENLESTFSKLAKLQPSAYDGAWSLWKDGIREKIMIPQFHGREHLNLKVFNELLKTRDEDLLTVLKNRSFARISNSKWSTISTTAAFDFWDIEENESFKEIIVDGLDAFENVFGFRATVFNAPAGKEHSSLHKVLNEKGVQYIDTPLIKSEHQGRGRYKKKINYTGKTNSFGQIFQVRNVLFEPTKPGVGDWAGYALKQIEYAFKWNRPAIISSHRVNFCGHIDPVNREKGIKSLKVLLKKIVERWPEVEFLAANELGEIIYNDKHG